MTTDGGQCGRATLQSYLLCSCCRSSTHVSLFVVVALGSSSSSMLLSLCLCLLQNEADRTLIYITLYITECLKKFQKVCRNICLKHVCSIFTCVSRTCSSSKTHNSDQSQLKVWFWGKKAKFTVYRFIGRIYFKKDFKFLKTFSLISFCLPLIFWCSKGF